MAKRELNGAMGNLETYARVAKLTTNERLAIVCKHPIGAQALEFLEQSAVTPIRTQLLSRDVRELTFADFTENGNHGLIIPLPRASGYRIVITNHPTHHDKVPVIVGHELGHTFRAVNCRFQFGDDVEEWADAFGLLWAAKNRMKLKQFCRHHFTDNPNEHVLYLKARNG